MSNDVDVVGLTEFAAICGVTRQAVSNWRLRYPNFPQPFKVLATGPLWYTSQAMEWAEHRQKTQKDLDDAKMNLQLAKESKARLLGKG